jgi:tetratricopeptide (TPR) repeat protein
MPNLNDVDALAERASALLDSAQLNRAKAVYLQICEVDPSNSGAWLMLGAIDAELGDTANASRCIGKAIELQPDYAEAHLTRGHLLGAQGRPDDALQSFRTAIASDPDYVEAHFALAGVLLAQERSEEAWESLDRAVKIDPEYTEAWLTLGWLHEQSGRFDAAEAAYRRCIELEPEDFETHLRLGNLLYEAGRPTDAVKSLENGLRLSPDHAQAHNNLGSALLAVGDVRRASESFERALKFDKNSAEAHANLGTALQFQGRYFQAATELRQALQLNPSDANLHYKLAGVLTSLGRFNEALENCEEALRIDPGCVDAITGKASILEKKGEHKKASALLQPLLQQHPPNTQAVLIFAVLSRHLGRQSEGAGLLENLLASESLASSVKIQAHTALGQLYDRANRFDEAFRHFRQANALKQSDFNPDTHDEFIDEIIEVFDADTMSRLPRALNQSERPILIVGLPRSGTTLVEQILASHPDCFGAGELIGLMGEIYALSGAGGGPEFHPRYAAELSQVTLDATAQRLLGRMDDLSQGMQRTSVNERPTFLFLGLVAQLFPNMRVVHCVRNPMDTCLSCYFQLLTMDYSYAYDLEHLGRYYKAYQRLMSHWKDTVQIPMLDLQYEALVADQENVIRALIDFCGLPWDDRCLRFYDTRRDVVTPSYNQVSQPIYRASVGRWKNYEAYLAPLSGLVNPKR